MQLDPALPFGVLFHFSCFCIDPPSLVSPGPENRRWSPLSYYYSALQPKIDSKIIKSNTHFMEIET